MTMMQAHSANDKMQSTAAEDAALAAFARAVGERLTPSASFAEIEREGLRLGNELCQRHQQADLERRAARWTKESSEELMIDGALYRYHADGSEIIHSLCGSSRVTRATYRQVGVHNGPIIAPLDVDAGLLYGATPALAFKLCEGYAQNPSRLVRKALLSSYREPPSRSAMERIAKELGGEIHNAIARLEPVVRVQESLPDGAFDSRSGRSDVSTDGRTARCRGSPELPQSANQALHSFCAGPDRGELSNGIRRNCERC